MNGQKVPAFKGPFHNYRAEKLAKQAASGAAQRPRLVTVAGSCGHEVALKTERYSEKGVRELVLALSKKPCGLCADTWEADQRLRDRGRLDRRQEARRIASDGYVPPADPPDRAPTKRRKARP